MTEPYFLEEIAKYQISAPFEDLPALELAAENIQIKTREDYVRCAELLRLVKDGKKLHEEHWESLRAAAFELYKSVTNQINAKSVPAEDAIKILTNKMSDFRLSQEKLNEERRQIAAAAHQESLEAAQQQARALMMGGKVADGLQVLQKAKLLVPAVEVQSLRLDGTSQIPDFDLVVTDLKAFLGEVASGNVPTEVIYRKKKTPTVLVNIPALKELKRGLGQAFKVAGIVVKDKIAYRSRK